MDFSNMVEMQVEEEELQELLSMGPSGCCGVA